MRRVLPLPLLLAVAIAAIAVIRLDSPNLAGAIGPDTWTTVAPMNVGRYPARSVTLIDGRVFVVGGSPATAQVYNPTDDSWIDAPAAAALTPGAATATLLLDGRVFVTVVSGSSPVQALIYVPASNSWIGAATAPRARLGFAAVRLADGRVLLGDGETNLGVPVMTPDIYDPGSDAWSSGAASAGAHAANGGALLADGRVLFTAERNNISIPDGLAEVYDPVADTWMSAGTVPGRIGATTTTLADGRVLVAAGSVSGSGYWYSVAPQVYDPASNTWATVGSNGPDARWAAASRLANGLVLVTGGEQAPASARVFIPQVNGWATVASMNAGRFSHASSLLTDGRVFVAGGNGAGFASAEIYEPGAVPATETPTSTPTPGAPPPTATNTPTATPTPSLPDLIVQSVADNQNFDCTRPAGIQITVANLNTVAAGPSTVFVDGMLAGQQSVAVPAIPGTSSVTVYSSVHGPGGLTYTVTADSTNAVVESDEGNNVQSGSLQTTSIATCTPTMTPTPSAATATPTPTNTPGPATATSTPALPDLIVVSISDRQQGALGCTTPAGLRIVIRNQGAASTQSAFTVTIQALSSFEYELIPVPVLAGRQSLTLFTTYTGIPAGDTYYATADGTDLITESDATNQVKSATLSIYAASTCTPSPTPGANTPTVTPTPTGFFTGDADGDGIANNADNCVFIYNPDQLNSDRNFISNHPAYVVDDYTLINSDLSGDACDSDWDNDGLPDNAEAAGPICGGTGGPTNAASIDTDHDGYKDGYECGLGFDPANPASKPPSPAPGTDPDNDGLSTSMEATLGTNPNNPDTDGDGLQDGWEVRGYMSNPLSIDTDNDGIRDGCEAASINADNVVNVGDQALLSAELMRAVPASQKLANFDLNKDGALNPGDQAFQASRIGSGKCP